MTSSKSADALEIKDDELEEYQIHDIREEIERLVFFSCLLWSRRRQVQVFF